MRSPYKMYSSRALISASELPKSVKMHNENRSQVIFFLSVFLYNSQNCYLAHSYISEQIRKTNHNILFKSKCKVILFLTFFLTTPLEMSLKQFFTHFPFLSIINHLSKLVFAFLLFLLFLVFSCHYLFLNLPPFSTPSHFPSLCTLSPSSSHTGQIWIVLMYLNRHIQ